MECGCKHWLNPSCAGINIFYPLSPIHSSLFTSPMKSIHPGAQDERHCERESAHGGVTRSDRSTINFGHVQVRTPAACMPGKCFIHCAMTLKQVLVQTSSSPWIEYLCTWPFRELWWARCPGPCRPSSRAPRSGIRPTRSAIIGILFFRSLAFQPNLPLIKNNLQQPSKSFYQKQIFWCRLILRIINPRLLQKVQIGSKSY